VDPVHPVLYKPTIWRNLLMFSPVEKYGGHSYDDVMLKPVAKALSQGLWGETDNFAYVYSLIKPAAAMSARGY
jgi:hypothetical protein